MQIPSDDNYDDQDEEEEEGDYGAEGDEQEGAADQDMYDAATENGDDDEDEA